MGAAAGDPPSSALSRHHINSTLHEKPPRPSFLETSRSLDTKLYSKTPLWHKTLTQATSCTITQHFHSPEAYRPIFSRLLMDHIRFSCHHKPTYVGEQHTKQPTHIYIQYTMHEAYVHTCRCLCRHYSPTHTTAARLHHACLPRILRVYTVHPRGRPPGDNQQQQKLDITSRHFLNHSHAMPRNQEFLQPPSTPSTPNTCGAGNGEVAAANPLIQ